MLLKLLKIGNLKGAINFFRSKNFMSTALLKQAEKKLFKATNELTEFPQLRQKLREYSDSFDRPLHIAVVGEYNAGKSTFLNAILQNSILPSGDIPTTGCVNYIRFSKTPSIVVHYKNGYEESITKEILQDISIHRGDSKHQLQQLKHIDVFMPAAILEKIVLIDTPGFNAPTVADRDITEKLLKESDGIIWLTSARQVLAATEVDILEEFRGRYRAKSLCVISQIDCLNDPKNEVPLLLDHAKNILSDYFIDIVAISALEAINGNQERMASFFKAFCSSILPRSQEIVVQTTLMDAINLIDSEMDNYQKMQGRLNKLQTSLMDLKKRSNKITNVMIKNINKLQDVLAKNLSHLQDNLVIRIQNDCTTWKDYEPYEKIISGIFTDDIVVEYRTIERWHWDEEKAKEAHYWLTGQMEKTIEEFTGECDRIFQKFAKELEQLNTAFINQNSDVINETDLNSIAQNLMSSSKFQDKINNLYSYFYGAMNHGGVFPVSWIIYMNKSESRPNTNQVTELVNYSLPLNYLIGNLRDKDDFSISIQTAVNTCYDWLDDKLSNQSDQVRLSYAKLENVQKAFL